MSTDLRRLGISVTNVSWGTHLCHFYETTQDLLATAVPYFQAGLETNEFCLWTIPESVRVEAMDALGHAVPDVDRYLAERQLEIIPIRDWYLAGGTFDGARVSSAWFQKLDEALARGYAGMRVSGHGDWVEERQWRDFSRYEAAINEAIRDRRSAGAAAGGRRSPLPDAVRSIARRHPDDEHGRRHPRCQPPGRSGERLLTTRLASDERVQGSHAGRGSSSRSAAARRAPER